MKKIGLFYGINAVKTAKIAKKIQEAFSDANIDVIPVEEVSDKEFKAYDNLILGAATWFDGELPSYWEEALPELEDLNLKGKKVAIFGLGNQAGYPDNFVDGIGILAETLESVGATIVGLTSIDGYKFDKSRAARGNQFLGLVIDQENQSGMTSQRIDNWVKQLKKEFA